MVCNCAVRTDAAISSIPMGCPKRLVIGSNVRGWLNSLYFTPPPVGIFGIGKVMHMMPFFIGGVLCCKYEWQKFLNGFVPLAITAVLFLVWNVLEVMPDPKNFISITVGILFSFSLCMNTARYIPSLFCSFRDYTFQIFLMGIFFQMAIRWAYVRLGNEMLFIPLWLLSVLIGVYAPTLIAKIIEKKTPKAVRLCFGL